MVALKQCKSMGKDYFITAISVWFVTLLRMRSQPHEDTVQLM